MTTASTKPAASSSSSNLVPLGRIVATHGVRGDLKLLPFNPDTDTLSAGLAVVLRKAGKDCPTILRKLRHHNRVAIISVDHCDSMTEAEALIGSELCVAEELLPQAGPDEFYHYQLIGMEVVTVDGNELGKVVEIIETGANDVCSVQGRGREYLIPFIDSVIRNVDVEQRRLVIDPLPGLLDL